MKKLRYMPALLSVALICGLIIVGGSALAEPHSDHATGAPDSMGEARAMGDPAASAPTAPMPEVTIYNGEEIDESTAMHLGLACMQTAKAYICKDSTDEFAGEGE